MSDHRNDPVGVSLKHKNTEITMRMEGAGAYVELIIVQGDQRIETRLNWQEIGDLRSIVSNLDDDMTGWND